MHAGVKAGVHAGLHARMHAEMHGRVKEEMHGEIHGRMHAEMQTEMYARMTSTEIRGVGGCKKPTPPYSTALQSRSHAPPRARPPPLPLPPPRSLRAAPRSSAPCRRPPATAGLQLPEGSAAAVGSAPAHCAPQLQVWSCELPALAHHVGAAEPSPALQAGGEETPRAASCPAKCAIARPPAARRAAAASQENSSCMKIERLQFASLLQN